MILGAGTGGVVAVNMLSHKLDLKDWRITVIDRASTHVYQPGLLFIPFRLYGYESQDDIVKSIESPIPKNARFITDHEDRVQRVISRAGLIKLYTMR